MEYVDQWLYCFDRETGEVKWKYRGLGPTISSPFIYNDLVYAGGERGVLAAVNLADGKEVWQHKFLQPIKASPVLENGRLFVAVYDHYVYGFK